MYYYYTIEQLAEELHMSNLETFLVIAKNKYHFLTTSDGKKYLMLTDKDLHVLDLSRENI